MSDSIASRRRFLAAMAVGMIAPLVLAGCGGFPRFGPSPTPSTEAPVKPTATFDPGPASVGFNELQSATVYIKGQGTFIDPGTLTPAEGRWLGSGFVVSPDGLVMTNNHVVTGAGVLDVYLGGDQNKRVTARVLGASECLDLAVLQLDSGTYPFMSWYKNDITTGLDVYSAGFPAGVAEEFTLTRGIVSKQDFPLDTSWASLSHVIEHDARIRGGSSGGPLVTQEGTVVGVNYAVVDALDYSFAIHRNEAERAFADLAAGTNLDSIGINGTAWQSDDGSLTGVWVSSIDAGGPADTVGVEPGDLIFKLAGVSVGTDGTLAKYCQVLRTQGLGGTMNIEIYRPGTDQLLEGQINGKQLVVTQNNVFGNAGGAQDTGGFTLVQDDTGSLSVSVPASWSDVDGSGFDGPGDVWWDALSAAPSLSDFWDSTTAAGLEFAASTDARMAPSELLDMLAGVYQSCTSVTTAAAYDDGWYTGLYSEWSCGSTEAYTIAVTDTNQVSAYMFLQLATPFEQSDGLSEIINTFIASY